MAVIEPKEESSSFGPVILVAVVLLIMCGIAYGIFALIHGPTTRTIKLSAAEAQKQINSGNMPAVPAGPPFPTMPPMPQEQDPGPTMVNIDLKNATVSQVTNALSKQAGVKFSSENRPGGVVASFFQNRFDYKVDNQPFWEAMKELARKGNASPNMYDYQNQRSEEISLQQGNNVFNLDCPQQEIGSNLLILNSVTSRFYADPLNDRTRNRSLNVMLTLCVEPKLNPYRITPVAVIEEARDENGASLIKPKDPWQDRNSGGGSRSRYIGSVNCILNFAPNAGQKIAKLKGYCSVIVAGPEQTVSIKGPLTKTNVDTKIGEQTLRLQRLQKQGPNNYEAYFRADGNSPVFKEWEIFSKVPKLLDARGKAYQHGGGGWGGGQPNYMDFSLYYNGDPTMSEPAELTITLPTNMREIRVPFEYTDLPLPH